jgi:RNA recognition motif-containing protein
MRHPSLSRTHAVLIIEKNGTVSLCDLSSKAGTKLDGVKLEQELFAYEVKNGGKMSFGMSTREYELKIDYSNVKKTFEKEKQNLEKDMRMLETLENPDLDIETLKKTLGLSKKDTVYVGGISYARTVNEIKEHFLDCGPILSVRMPENPQTKQNKGFAFITFETEDGAKKALQNDGTLLDNRKLKVNITEKKADFEDKGANDRGFKDKNKAKYEAERDFDRRHKRHRDDSYDRRDDKRDDRRDNRRDDKRDDRRDERRDDGRHERRDDRREDDRRGDNRRGDDRRGDDRRGDDRREDRRDGDDRSFRRRKSRSNERHGG